MFGVYSPALYLTKLYSLYLRGLSNEIVKAGSISMFFLNGRLYFPRKVLATSRFSHHIAFILFLNNYSYSSSRRHNIKKKTLKKSKK